MTYCLVFYKFDSDIFFPSIIFFFFQNISEKWGFDPQKGGAPMDIQSEAYDFRNLYKITNKMVYNLFGNNLIPRYMLTAPDYKK